MCEISALEHKQTETKEHGVEIGSVSKRGGGSTSGIQGHRKPQHVSARQCQQGRKFSTRWESISHREWRTWKEAYRETLKYCILSYWIWSPVLFFFSFFAHYLQAGGSSQEELPRARPKTMWPRKREERGKEIVLGFTSELNSRQKKRKNFSKCGIK